ncbi:uncharacterized protein K452DRAFT_166085 [Aplosporella prunicola CBS 121167]|uniref:Uncharacterized protein n=1 Tax=Aplosporella prunicola CBS 121167 TaxID=1176127 RepID=A0A6A6AWX1_9PEZI|nr:uncharacterized protein K452DRAFT_166085 [Aplosporella prunicola CBS 121167]KAF2135673.1 hypothetical protein K452DRAFT_166085 [Aplosporella prunicola CBS 121167]
MSPTRLLRKTTGIQHGSTGICTAAPSERHHTWHARTPARLRRPGTAGPPKGSRRQPLAERKAWTAGACSYAGSHHPRLREAGRQGKGAAAVWASGVSVAVESLLLACGGRGSGGGGGGRCVWT